MAHHLSPEAFVDVLDGTAPEQDVLHVGSCDECSNRLVQLRTSLHAAMQADVPEPSPLFWEHLSSRVREDVRREAQQPARGTGWTTALGFSWWRFAGLASAGVAAVALVVSLDTSRVLKAPSAPETSASQPSDPLPTPVSPVQGASSDSFDSLDQDGPLGFVADLASGLDWDDAAQFGLSSPGEVDRSLVDLDEGDRVELSRLLRDALGSGA